MLWIALYLPQLPLQALPGSHTGLEAALPVAVTEQHMLLGANRAAHALGVRAGQSVATALSLLPQLVVFPRDRPREAALVERLALALAALTPHLSLTPDGVLLEVQSTLRLFGGIHALLHRAQALARASGVQARTGCAPTPGAAWLFATSGLARRHALQARSSAQQLDRLPVASLARLLPPSPHQSELLQALGVRTFGALRALPRAGLQRRLGVDLGRALDCCYGDAPDPRPWFVPPEHFLARRELLQRADEAAVLMAVVEALLPALRGWLQLRWQAVTVLALRLRHEHGREPCPDTRLRLQLSAPSRDIAQLALLWRERLQRHVLAAPVYELALELEAAVPHGGTPGELLPAPGRQDGEHAALLDRLTARLGSDHVQRWVPVADHRPEHAQRVWSAGEPPPAPFATTAPAPAAPRPLWLLPLPLPLASDALGRPRHGGPLRVCSRAERIEAGWFDGALVRRDYHVAEGPDHRLRWIYREHPGDASSVGWFLHGWFG